MSSKTVMRFKEGELQELLGDPYAHLIVKKNVKHQVALMPNCLGDKNVAICATLDRDLMTYHHQHKGILLSYKNPRRVSPGGKIDGDKCHIGVDILVDLYIFAPTVGCTLNAIVSKKSPDGISCLVHKNFNVAVPRHRDGTDDEWPGSFVEIGQDVMLQVEHLNFSDRLPYIRGRLVTDELSTKNVKKSTHKIQLNESEPSEGESDSAVIKESSSPQKKKKKSKNKDKLELEGMIDLSSIIHRISANQGENINIKSRDRPGLQSVESELQSDFSVTKETSSPQKKKKKSKNKDKSELDGMIDLSSIINQISANQEENINNKSRDRPGLQSVESELQNDFSVTKETSSPQKKKKKSKNKDKSELDGMIDLSSIINQISANQEENINNKSRDRPGLQSVESELQSDFSVTKETSSIRKKKKKSKHKDKSGLEHMLDFSSITDQISANQEESMKKTSKDSLQSTEGEHSELISDYPVTEETLPAHKKKRKSKNIDKSEVVGMIDSSSIIKQISANQKENTKRKSKDRLQSIESEPREVRHDVAITEETSLSQKKKRKNKEKSRTKFEIEQSFLPITVNDVPTSTAKMLQSASLNNETLDAVNSRGKKHPTKLSKCLPVEETILISSQVANNENNTKKSKKKKTTENMVGQTEFSAVSKTGNLKAKSSTLDTGAFDYTKLMENLLSIQKKNIIGSTCKDPLLDRDKEDNKTKHKKEKKHKRAKPEGIGNQLEEGSSSSMSAVLPEVSGISLPKSLIIPQQSTRKRKHREKEVYDDTKIGNILPDSSSSVSVHDPLEQIRMALLKEAISKSTEKSPIKKSKKRLVSSSEQSSVKETHTETTLGNNPSTSADVLAGLKHDSLQPSTKRKSSKNIPTNVKYDAIEELQRKLLNQAITETKLDSPSKQPRAHGKKSKSTTQIAPGFQNEMLKRNMPTMNLSSMINRQGTPSSSSSSSDDDFVSMAKNKKQESKKTSTLIHNMKTDQTSVPSFPPTLNDKLASPGVRKNNKQQTKKSKVILENTATNLITKLISSSLSSSVEIPKTKVVPVKNSLDASKKKKKKANLPSLAVPSGKSSESLSSDLATKLLQDHILNLKSK